MRHRVAGKKLNRSMDQRTALRRGLISDLFRHDAITTTEARADAIRGQAEKLITLARHRGNLSDLVELAKAGDRVTLARRLTPTQAETLIKTAQTKPDALNQAAAAIVVAARRQAARTLYRQDVVKRLFDEIAPRYATRSGGYTRTFKLGQRKGDAAPIVRIELLEAQE
ncbi:MAG TPA: L17 family ribosomal protein [Anaerolineae bacterium]|nr:L17 family ribosomal protein [Anaerolineae bacterium]